MSRWPRHPLKHVAEVSVSNVDKKSAEGELPVRLVNYTDVYYGDRLAPSCDLMAATAGRRQIEAFRLLPGDVVITKDSETAEDIGVAAFIESSASDIVLGYHLALVRPRRGLAYGRYIYWSMCADDVRGQLATGATGVTRFGLRADSVRSVLLAVPSIGAQQAIADFLDAEAARIDGLIFRKRRMVSLIEERSLSRQIELVTGRHGGDRVRHSGQAWLGDIPTHWSLKRLKHIARLETGHTPSRTRPELWENCTVPWVTPNDVGYLAENEFIQTTVNLISEAGIAASSARVLPAGTVVLSRDATIGRVGILSRPMATSQHFVDWVCGPELRSRYLWLVFRTVMQSHFNSLTDGATLRTIGMPDVLEFLVPVPPVEEQDVIVKRAENYREKARVTRAALDEQIRLLQEHRQALITAAVTGEMEVPGVAA